MVSYWERRRLRKNLLARRNEPSLSGYPVCLVYQVSFMQLNKPDKPNRPMNKTAGGLFQHPVGRGEDENRF